MSGETQVNPQTLVIGAMLEDYRIDSVLGQGGFGITYKATDQTLRRRVVIKEYLPQQFAFRDGSGMVRPRRPEDEEMFTWGLNRFVDEGRTLAMFRHPNIVSVMRYFEGNGTAYLVMDFESGQDLKRWRSSHGRPDETLLVERILMPVLEGLARVHDKGLLHRDIKPDNIIIRDDGSPVLIDFGASRAHGAEGATQLTSIVSAGYSPFEQYGSGQRQGPWSDLYALAGTMYWLIAGRPPADAIARQQGAQLVPAAEVGAGVYTFALLNAIDRALILDIEARPQNAREMLALIRGSAPDAAADPDATVVRRPGGRTPETTPGRGRRTAIWMFVAALGTGLATAVYLGLVPLLDAPGKPASVPVGEAAEPEAPGPAAATADAADSRPTEPAVAEPALPDSLEPATPERPEPPSPGEDDLLAGLGLPTDVLHFRADQLSGALLAYTSTRGRFDTCREQNCELLPQLLADLQASMEPQSWRRGAVGGAITIRNPRRLDSEQCPFMIDLIERLESNGGILEQERTYCTSNGLDRVVQAAGGVVRIDAGAREDAGVREDALERHPTLG